MTIEEARALAQTDPTENLSKRFGQVYTQARREIDALSMTLFRLDGLSDQLAEHGIRIDVDLGPIGNSAAAARRDMDKQNVQNFALPKAS